MSWFVQTIAVNTTWETESVTYYLTRGYSEDIFV